MLPAAFEYHRPDTLDEALSLLSAHADDGKVLAGGQSLIPLMKLRFAAPGHLIDINRISGLDGLEEADGHLKIGAMTRHATLEHSDLLKSRYPVMAQAAPMISDPLVRNLGTIGGSLAHADPAGDWGSVMLAMGATIVVRSPNSDRELPIGEFLQDTFTTALEPDEIVTEIRVPQPVERSGGAYLKMERKVGDFATVAVGVHLELSNGTIGRAGIALTAVGSKNIEATEAEQHLAGAEPTEEAFAEAGRLAAAAADPVSDVRGSADYKRHVVDVFVRRGLARALDSARSL
ncbi:MAG TPA: xanthine dehydrogenase family protein subunit M [Actinomycetota bacterium]|nr:xanthine dehydrogenase family protein subunit M [Actinomycetota bacterium]